MTKKTRFIILLFCVFLFFLITPYIIFYSLGYRIDFEKRKIVATGGLYIKALPLGTNIIVDSKIHNKTGIFSNAVFVQNLIPKTHHILITKDGYYDYQKNLKVKENEVTKLESIILFKKNIPFILLENSTDYFSVSPDNSKVLLAKINSGSIDFELIGVENQQKQSFSLLAQAGLLFTDAKISNVIWSNNATKALLHIKDSYFLLNFVSLTITSTPLPLLNKAKEALFDPQDDSQIFYIKNSNLYSSTQSAAILKNVASYQIANQNILWFSYDGFLYNSDMNGKLLSKINTRIFPVKKTSSYEVKITPGLIFLKQDASLFVINKSSKSFEKLYDSFKNLKASPNINTILYCNAHEVLLSPSSSDSTGSIAQADKIVLHNFSEQINDCYWLNNDYIAIEFEHGIIISEINNDNPVNIVHLPQTIFLTSGKDIDVKNPKIYFDQQNKKLYILTQNNLLLSEKIIP